MTLDFGKDKTAIIKGIAILMMIVLHCAIPGYWDNPPLELANECLAHFMGTFKLCVGIFTFMVGYGYAFSKTKDARYSLEHIQKLLIPFWVILFIFTLPASYNNLQGGVCYKLTMNSLGINSELNWFSWFVAFYIYAMIIMPFISRIIDRSPVLWATVCIGSAFACEIAMHELCLNYTENDWTQRLFDCLMQTPGMILGYLFAKQGWYSRIRIPQTKLLSLLALLLMACILIVRSCQSAIVGFNLDFFYAPLFILAILIIFRQFNLAPFRQSLVTLGNTSVFMWFFHALFFTQATRAVYQPLVAISDSLWISIGWVVLLTFACSWLLTRAVQGVEWSISKLARNI